MKRKIKDNKGFTLMELLCVIGIVVIMTAIVLPTFSGKLEKSREAVDISNLRNAAAAVKYSYMLGEACNGATKKTTYYQLYVPMKQKEKGWQTYNTTKSVVFNGGSCNADTTKYKVWYARFYFSGTDAGKLKFAGRNIS